MQPSFDNWTIIFLFFAGLGFLLSFFFFVKKSANRVANILLGFYMILYSLMMIEYVLFWTHYLQRFPHWVNISGGFPFLYGPLLLFYFYSVYEKRKPGFHFILHLLPFLLYVTILIPFYISPGEVKMGRHFSSITAYTFLFAPWIGMLVMAIYASVIFGYIKRQNSIGEVKKWSMMILSYFSLYILSSLSYYLLVRLPGFRVEWDYFISFVISAGILSIAWFGFAYPAIFSGYSLKESVLSVETFKEVLRSQNYIYHSVSSASSSAKKNQEIYSYRKNIAVSDAPPLPTSEPIIKYKNSGLTDSAASELAQSLMMLMGKEHLYKENDLSLENLSKKLNTNKHHLSQVINEFFGMNFFDYINSLRIKEACVLLKNKSKSELNAIEIAYMVGFNNKVTFNSAFKKFTGLTPSEYRKQT